MANLDCRHHFHRYRLNAPDYAHLVDQNNNNTHVIQPHYQQQARAPADQPFGPGQAHEAGPQQQQHCLPIIERFFEPTGPPHQWSPRLGATPLEPVGAQQALGALADHDAPARHLKHHQPVYEADLTPLVSSRKGARLGQRT